MRTKPTDMTISEIKQTIKGFVIAVLGIPFWIALAIVASAFTG